MVPDRSEATAGIAELKQRLLHWIERRSTVDHVAHLAGLSPDALHDLLTTRAPPSREILDRLASVLRNPHVEIANGKSRPG